MKKPHRKLVMVAISLILAAGFLLPAIRRAKRHGTRSNSVNSFSSFSFSVSTNALASRQNPER
jgi:hypothetical protein